MSVLDTFYLLFKTDATTGAASDIKQLENQIDSLTAKGRKRSDEENKQLLLAKKNLKSITDELKDQQKQIDKIGDSFVKVVEGAVGALTAFASFGALKSGLADAARINSVLHVNQQITGQSAGEIKAWSAAVESAGGSADGFLSTIQSMTKAAAEAGRPLTNISGLLRYIHSQIAGQPVQEQRRILGLYGIADPGLIALLEQSNAEFEKNIKEIQKHADATNRAAPSAREFENQWSKTKRTFEDVFSVIDQDILPAFTKFLKSLEDFGTWLSGHEHVAEAFFVGLGAASIFAAGAVSKLAFSMIGLGSASVTGAITSATLALSRFVGVLGLAVGAGAIGGGIGDIINGPDAKRQSIIGKGTRSISDFLLDWYYGPVHPYSQPQSLDLPSRSGRSPLGIRSNNPGNLMPGGREAVFSSPQAGISALSSQLGRYGARGWDTLESILYHYAPSGENNTEAYIDAVSKATGFQRGQKLDLSDPSVLQKLIPAIIKHENGYNPYSDTLIQQSIQSAKGALSSGAQTPLNPVSNGAAAASSNINVKIDDVNVHTQATDASGISRNIGAALETELRTAISSLDDGVMA